MRQVTLAELLAVYMVVNVDGLPPRISPELLDELPGHTRAPQMSSEPVPAAMR